MGFFSCPVTSRERQHLDQLFDTFDCFQRRREEHLRMGTTFSPSESSPMLRRPKAPSGREEQRAVSISESGVSEYVNRLLTEALKTSEAKKLMTIRSATVSCSRSQD